MNKTKPTLARQTYEKVCVLETMLKAHLDGKPPMANTDKSALDKQPFLATAAPGEALAVIRLADAPGHLPCFDEADLLYGIPGLPILMSYCPAQVLYVDDEAYLTGSMIFFRIDRDGYTVSITVDDLYKLAEFLDEHSLMVVADGIVLPAIRLD